MRNQDSKREEWIVHVFCNIRYIINFYQKDFLRNDVIVAHLETISALQDFNFAHEIKQAGRQNYEIQ